LQGYQKRAYPKKAKNYSFCGEQFVMLVFQCRLHSGI